MLMNDIWCLLIGLHLVVPGLHRVVTIHGLLGLAQGRDFGKKIVPVLLLVLLLVRGYRRERELPRESLLQVEPHRILFAIADKSNVNRCAQQT
jgi:hypothetical protein